MELTWEEWKAMKKALRRRLGVPGWTLLVYYGIMNIAVFFWVFAESMFRMTSLIVSGDFYAVEEAVLSAAESGWGYFLAAGVGLLILLLWKKPRFWREQICARGKPMRFGRFLGNLCVFFGGQFLSQIALVFLELVLNQFGLTILEGVDALSVNPNNFSMFLYAGILAPVTEEILFRGLIQRTLMPYGRNFAIFASAFTFGLFHGNLIQTPFAFLVGLVLGYVAAEYSIFWAMLLHMINNLVLADALNRLTSFLPEEAAGLIVWGILLFFAVAAAVILIVKRAAIRSWLSRERIHKTYLGCFFSSAGMIAFMTVMALTMVSTLFVMITPL